MKYLFHLTRVVSVLPGLIMATAVNAHPNLVASTEYEALAKAYALALLNSDPSELKSFLSVDFQTISGEKTLDKAAYLAEIRARTEEVSEVLLHYARPGKNNGQQTLGPILLRINDGKTIFPVHLRIGRDAGGQLLLRGFSYGGRIPEELVDQNAPEYRKLFPVKFGLVESATSHPIQARVSIHDKTGHYWAPLGHDNSVTTAYGKEVGGDVVLEGQTWAYVQPGFTANLPAGDYSLEATRGMEYLPVKIGFSVPRPNDAPVSVPLERWIDMKSRGWYSADTHIHFMDPTTTLLEAQGEDLDIANILAAKWGNFYTNVEQFTGALSQVSTANTLVYVNQESRHGFLGHTIGLNLKTLVPPFSWGGRGEGVQDGFDYPAMAQVAQQVKHQGGTVSWAHLPLHTGELAVDAALGCVDAIDLLTWGDAFQEFKGKPSALSTWYRLLNAGFKLPALAGTDKMLNVQVIGSVRSYAQVNGSFGYDSWIDAVRAGKTFVTTGPMLFLRVDDHEIGDKLNLEAPKSVRVTVEARSAQPVERVEIVVGGRVVATTDKANRDGHYRLDLKIPVAHSSWIAARAYSAELLPFQQWHDLTPEGIPLMAHTSPVYIELGKQPATAIAALDGLITDSEKALEWASAKANYHDSQEKQRVEQIFNNAIAALMQRRQAVIDGTAPPPALDCKF